LARELRLTDQILSADLDAVSVEYSGPAPAWTTLEGDKVSFAYAMMPPPETASAVAVWIGTNAHELGHVLFSPRRDSTLMYRVLESERTFLRGIANLHNIVEDQRQERLLLARFSPWAGYLTAALSHHIVVNDDSAWLLLAGRTWLPDSVRTLARTRMVARLGTIVADEVTRLIGDYQRLIDPGDTEADEAWEILQALHRLFENDQPDFPHQCTVVQGGEPDTSDPDEDDLPPAADESDAPQGADGTPGKNDDADAADEGDDGDADADGEGNADDSQQPGAGAGTNPAKSPGTTQEQIREGLADAADAQISADAEAKSDLDSILDALENGRPGERPEGSDRVGRYEPASDSAKRLHREVADALLDLKDEAEAGWVKRTDSGRLNARRLAMPNVDPDALFDRYEPGQMDAADMELVLLVDVSSSMARFMERLAEATWAIRTAADELEATTTVIAYDSGPHRIIASPDERPDGRMFVHDAMGGTTPLSALTEAYQVLAGSQLTHRLMVVLTDGDWAGQNNDDVIAAMNDAGITTVCALLGTSLDEGNIHRCQYGARITNPAELAILFRRVATERIRERMSN